MAWLPYDSHKTRQYTGSPVNFSADTIKLMLLASGYTPDRAAHVFQSDLTSEVTGTNYSAGGLTLAGITAAIAANILHVDADDVTIAQSASGFTTARYAVLVKSTGVAATSPLICYADLGGNVGNVVGPLSFPIADIFTF